MKPQEIEKLITDAGWERVKNRGKGSHRVYIHNELPGLIVLPYHKNRDVPTGTLNGILKTAGLAKRR